MNIDRTHAPAGAAPAESKRSWISPAVMDMGGMRQLTLLQGSGEVDCGFDEPDCEV